MSETRVIWGILKRVALHLGVPTALLDFPAQRRSIHAVIASEERKTWLTPTR